MAECPCCAAVQTMVIDKFSGDIGKIILGFITKPYESRVAVQQPVERYGEMYWKYTYENFTERLQVDHFWLSYETSYHYSTARSIIKTPPSEEMMWIMYMEEADEMPGFIFN